VDYKLPVDVYVGNNQGDTLYSPTDSDILISAADASFSSSNRPKNREYHEFGHHLMYAEYLDWPSGRKLPGVKNHDGFLNPNTGDSYLEGFAEFYALAVSKEVGDKTPDIYASFGSLENNYVPWDSQGKLEEFAVASLLWDMYDSVNEKGDGLTFSLDEIWAVLKVKRADFYEYYKAFKETYPKKSKEIDELFILHGFFADTTVGNKVVDNFEPWKWTNQAANQYFFVDLGALNSTQEIQYKAGMDIGKAANYERFNRSSAVRVENAFLAVEDKNAAYYTVKVHYNNPSLGKDYEYDVDVREGRIYLNPLPGSADATITVVADSEYYTTAKPFTITSFELSSKVNAIKEDKGYFAQHRFEVKPISGKKEPGIELFNNAPLTYKYEGDIGELGESPDESEINLSGLASTLMSIFILLLAGGMVCVLGYFALKTKENREKTWNILKAIFSALKSFTIKVLIPIVKLVAKGIWWGVKKAVELTKLLFNKSKPHIKKLHEKVKEKISKKK
jgi:hypothetical protein